MSSDPRRIVDDQFKGLETTMSETPEGRATLIAMRNLASLVGETNAKIDQLSSRLTGIAISLMVPVLLAAIFAALRLT